MPPERFPADDPREWLRRANSNLAQARRPEETVCLEDLCFQAQQAAEKALKALLLARGCRPPYTHDLGALLRLIEKAGETVPADVSRIVRLTDYDTRARRDTRAFLNPSQSQNIRKLWSLPHGA
jgi:HEPN domain-containing protein